jgi:hypothetical protein
VRILSRRIASKRVLKLKRKGIYSDLVILSQSVSIPFYTCLQGKITVLSDKLGPKLISKEYFGLGTGGSHL